MYQTIKIIIDGKECIAKKGQYIVEAAKENNIYIPTLCNIEGVKPKGACRICTVKVNGRLMTACTTPVAEGMSIESESAELTDLRRSIIELLFVEGNHFCPACEKSGECILQALAYRYSVMAPRFPFMFPIRELDASNPKIIKDHNRCVLCKRCIRVIKDDEGKNIFAFKKRGHKVEIIVDPESADKFTDELAEKAMEICPVGAILVKGKGFKKPIGQRKYDLMPIGSDIEKVSKSKKAVL
ncbi:MAG: (2Fe-2S)-binding protein [Prolixibacteraceae bacterium]|nr:(2Fe-2S)-binding protein [Prolixibacteraceae bacterium]